MTDSVSDGRTTVWLVPSIANIAAPTTTEINAGTNITDLLTPDGLSGFQASTDDVDNTSLGSTFNTALPGRVSFSNMALKFKWQQGTDTQYNTLVWGYSTNVVVRRRVTKTTAIASSQLLQVYPVTCGERSIEDAAPNTLDMFTAPLKPSGQPNLASVVA